MPNKLTKSEYVSKVADALTKAYGNTLREDNTDVQMAKAVVRRLHKYLFFRAESADSRRRFQAWKKKAYNR